MACSVLLNGVKRLESFEFLQLNTQGRTPRTGISQGL